MKHLTTFLLLMVLARAGDVYGATWIGARLEQPQVKLLADRAGSITFEILPGGFELGRAEINGKEYATIEMPAAGPSLTKGYPEFPVLAQSVIIPDAGGVDIKLVSVETSRMKCPPPVPSKGNLYRDIDPQTVPYSFGPVYGSSAVYPAVPVRLSPPFILRDFRAATVQLFPVQYDFAKGELIIIQRVVVEVLSNRAPETNALRRISNTIDREFQPLYQSLFLNYLPQAVKYDTLTETGLKMLVITADAYRTNLQPLVEWKRRKGYQVKVVNVSTVGNNAASIKNYIQNEYDTNHPSYVLLVGEATEVAPGVGTEGTANGETSDPIYSLLAGADNYPDIFIGRFSAGSAAHVDVQVAKSISYERTPQIGGTWYGTAVGIASNEDGGTSIYDSTRMNWLRDTLLTYGYTAVDKMYQGTLDGTAEAITNSVNAGRGLVNYIGHGSQTSWASINYTVFDVQTLANDNLLPVVNSVACVVGDFAGTDECFCEAWQWAGTADLPTGSVVHYGSSINQSWVPPCLSQREATNLIAKGIQVTAGGFFYNGSCRMMEICADSLDPAIDMFQAWHIFGDASVPIRTAVPKQLAVTHSVMIPVAPGVDLPVHVGLQGSGTPVAMALVCATLKSDTLFQSTGYTNVSGDVILPITTSQIDSMFITVTGFNLAPYEGIVPVIAPAAYVIHLKHTISDAAGNNDGVANPGETVHLPTWVKNYGTSQADNVTAILRTSGPNGTVTADSNYFFGTIGTGDSAYYGSGFGLLVNPADTNGTAIPLTLECRDGNDSVWNSSFSLTVGTAMLAFESKAGIFYPNEVTKLMVTLKNNGLGYSYNTQAVVRCGNSLVTITDSTAGYGTINPGAVGTGSDSFTVEVGAVPAGTIIELTLVMKATGTSDRLYNWNEMVGNLRYQPTPDNTAGMPWYYAVEDSDGVGRAPVYQWAEIRPTGTQLPLDDEGIASVTLPFTFNWYGTDYTALSVGSNGWISFGPNSNPGYDNTAIPAAAFAAPTVFPLWNDLDATSRWVGYYNDAANHRFIVEYDSIVYYGTLLFNKFQVIYYDSTAIDPYHDVVLQYHLFTDGMGAFSSAYPSVGFQQNGTVGSQLLYNHSYASTALPLASLRAVRITRYPEPLGVEGPPEVTSVMPQAYHLGLAYPNPARSAVTIAYQLPKTEQAELVVYNIAGQKVKILASGVMPAGNHTVRWDGRDESGQRVSAGVYLYRLTTPGCSRIGKLSIVK